MKIESLKIKTINCLTLKLLLKSKKQLIFVNY